MSKNKLKVDIESKLNKNSSEYKLFIETPVWKILLKMSIPGMIIMLIFGLYTFLDNILAINFAYDYSDYVNEAKNTTSSSKDLVRLFMGGISPVSTFILAIGLLFGVGVSRRFSINIGRGMEDRAIKTVKTTMMVGIITSLVLMPVLILTSEPWIKSQFDGDPHMASLIAKEGYKYIWIIIITFPIQMFNQITSSIFRAEAKNKQMLVATFFPIAINLLFDWILMGPCGMGISGGAWATFISYVITAIIISIYMLTIKETRVRFKSLFGFKGVQFITIVGVMLVGIAPFLRNFAQSITPTIELRKIQEVSEYIYHSPMQMTSIMTAVFPIFGLFFPMVFGIIQAGSPITSYNYGAKNFARVKSTTMWVTLYSTIIGIFIFVISTFTLIDPLTSLLGISDHNLSLIVSDSEKPTIEGLFKSRGVSLLKDTPISNRSGFSILTFDHIFYTLEKARKMYGIMMFSMVVFGPTLGAMSLLGSTDRISLNIFASSLRGILLLIPFLYIFAAIAVNMDTNWLDNLLNNNGIFSSEYFFWWFYPALALMTTIILSIVSFLVMRKLEQNHKPLEVRLQEFHLWAREHREKRLLKRKNR